MTDWIAPTLIDLSIAGTCNLSCKICNITPTPLSPMDTSLVLETISHLDDMHIQIIDLLGGEPLMRKDWPEITEHVSHNTDMALIFSSNGVLWHEKDIQFMAALPGDLQVAISLDGPTPFIHGQIRAPQNAKIWENIFEKTVHTIRSMKEYDIEICVNYVVTSLNYHHIFDTYSLCEDMGVKNFNIIRFYPVGVGFSHHAELDVSHDLWVQFVRNLAELSITKGEFGNISVLTHFWEIFVPLIPLYGKKDALLLTQKIAHPCSGPLYCSYRNAMTTVGCNAGITQAYIDCDGSVYPCGLIPRYELLTCGNVTGDTFLDIWEHSPVLQWIRSHNVTDIPGCSECEYVDLCGGGCRGRALALTGDFYGPDMACPLLSLQEDSS